MQLLHLANHSSGLPGASHVYTRATQDSLGRLSMVQRIAYYNQYGPDSLLNDLHRLKLNSRPGTAYRYNGMAMKLLQLLLERIYQQPYEQLHTAFLQKHYGLAATKRVLTPAEFVEEMRAAPFPFALFHPLCGGMPPELAWSSLHLFEHEVLPAFG